MPNENSSLDETRVGSALLVAITGLIIPACLVVFLVFQQWKAADIVAVVGVFTSIVGTLVGAFLGVQIGSAGKQKAESIARRALEALPVEKAKEILGH